MLNRRAFFKAFTLVALFPASCVKLLAKNVGVWVNDIHSKLNPTLVNRIEIPMSLGDILNAFKKAKRDGRAISITGGRHAMGAQQFGTDTVLFDTTKLNNVLHFDRERGLIEVEAGIQWPELIDYLVQAQHGEKNQWGIAQKQTGADRMSIGGALAANAHGRGLRMKPFVADVEFVRIINAKGKVLSCSRNKRKQLFSLIAGGYGLFGFTYSVTVRLVPRQKLERVVELVDASDLSNLFQKRTQDGFIYGDFQFSIDDNSDNFLKKGVFSTYRPVDPDTPMPDSQKHLKADDWRKLLYLAHTDKNKTYETYSNYYLSTSGQIYWSDTHQLSTYLDDYHLTIDQILGSTSPDTEMITELYVPREKLPLFLDDVRNDFRRHNVNLIYGTIRWIEKDTDSFLPWAQQSYVATVMNLHVDHTAQGKREAADSFRRLIDIAIRHGGSYFLTYHKYATRSQVETCYPNFTKFLQLKRKYDPKERFQSDWYRHYRRMFSDAL